MYFNIEYCFVRPSYVGNTRIDNGDVSKGGHYLSYEKLAYFSLQRIRGK